MTTITSKTYSSRSNVRRAAKTAGIETYEIVKAKGGFAYQYVEVEAAPVAEVEAAPVAEATVESIMELNAAPVAGGSPSVLPEDEVAAPAKDDDDKRHRSVPMSPTKLVWHIADAMLAKNPNVSRKEIMAECDRQGIAYYTARTQIQLWKKALRGETLTEAD